MRFNIFYYIESLVKPPFSLPRTLNKIPLLHKLNLRIRISCTAFVYTYKEFYLFFIAHGNKKKKGTDKDKKAE